MTTPSGEARERLRAAQSSARRQIESLSRTFDEIVDASTDVATDDEHDPEGHTIAWERQQVAALLAQARADLTAVDAALARLDDGAYGTCATCGGPIGEERLDALPEITTCIDCARLVS